MDESTVDAVFDTLPDLFYVFDANGTLVEWNDRLVEVTGYDDDELDGMNPLDFIPEEDHAEIGTAIDAVLVGDNTETRQSALVTADGERVPYEFNATRLTGESGEVIGFAGTGRNLSKRRKRERALRQQRDELETLNRLNELVREVVHELVGAATREEIEKTVCRRLADSDLYRFAWVGDHDLVEDGIVPRTLAGEDQAFQELVGEVERENKVWERPATRAFRTGRHVVVRDFARTPILTDRLRERGLERGLRSGIAVPLSYKQTRYGVLVVYATRTNAFSEREVAGFDTLGELVGFAINATENKKLLATDQAAVELMFRVTDDEALLVDLSRRIDCTLVLDGTVPTSDGQYLYYVRVEDARPERVADAAATLSTVNDSRVVWIHDEEGLLVLTVSSSLVENFIESSAKVVTAEAHEGTEDVVVEVTRETNIRTLLESIRTSFPDIELVAKRDVERTDQSKRGFQDDFSAELTGRQRSAFRAAYLAGYYDWPRESTAEQVAESMGIAPATLHQHLRKAEGKLASAFFSSLRD
ncbi:bacterio-opsin activator domain-containing protein [Haladaptatus sp. CMAA 1911]|uniref:bacterio-opsin activator domain-containing protein n=1 Tax=unclassified Haladaptatus TaxID=2622732 RepID=UPI003754AA86